MRKPSLLQYVCVCCLFVYVAFASEKPLAAQRIALPGQGQQAQLPDQETGALPDSQSVTLTVRLKPDSARASALETLIKGQQAAGSANYRKWITAGEFASQFGATEEQIAAVTTWLEAQGLKVSGISAGRTRLTATGAAARVAAAFDVQLRQYRTQTASGEIRTYFANASPASVPEALGALIGGVSGLDDRPLATPMSVTALASDGLVLGTGDSLASIEEMVDTNAAARLVLTTKSCAADFAPSDVTAYKAVLLQAEAQGITVLATSACAAGSFPAGLSEVTAVVAAGDLAAAEPAGMLLRPEWQIANGLPEDGLRATPDVAADIDALSGTLGKISVRAGTRLGNVAPVLYALSQMPDLYLQPDGVPPGTWEPSTGLGVVDLQALAKDFPQGSTGTSSLLVPSNYAPSHGASLTLTATVTSTGGSGIPTGTVTFTSTQKGTLGSAVLDASGVAKFTIGSLAAGTYTITSVYAGDATYAGSTSGVATVTVVGEVSVMSATVAMGAAVGGSASIAVSVTSASGVGTPSGTVTVAPQGTKNSATATATLSGSNGTATGTILLPVYEAGQFTLLISCSDPDPSFTCYSPVSVQMTVGKGNTTTTLTDTSANPAAGTTYTLTATVAGGAKSAVTKSAAARSARSEMHAGRRAQVLSGSASASASGALETTTSGPTGNVQFMDGTTYLGTGTIASGVATYNGTSTTATHSFNALYSGDQNYSTSTSTSTPAATGLLPTSTSLTASSYAIAVGQTITFYSTVYSVGVPSTMTGTVTYSAATQGVLGVGTVSNGLSTVTLNSLSPGTYVMTATYSGDGTFAGSSSVTTVVVTVAGGVATLAGSFNPSSVPYGSDAVLTATASFPAGSVGGPAGTLVATVAGVSGAVYTQTLLASTTTPTSVTVFTFPAPPPGIYTVTISCPAADTFTCTAPVKVPLTVVRGNTATALTLTPQGPLAGQPVTLTATISNMGNDPRAYTFTGTVQFFANNQLLGTSVVNGVTASLIAALPAGSEESLTAVYSGDVNWTTSISTPILLTVAALPTTIVVSSNVTNAISGVQVVLTATVTNIAGGPLATTAPTGSVSFYDTYNGVLSKLGTAPLVSQGADTSLATFNATGLTTGLHSVYAIYLGDMIYLGATSPAITIGSTNFAVTFVPSTMTLKQGQTGSSTLVVNFQGGFGGTVTFGCTPPPNIQMTCSFSPSVLAASGTTMLNVATTAPSAAPDPSNTSDSRVGGGVAGGVAMAMLLIWLGPKKRMPELLLLLLAVVSLGAMGCSGTNLNSSTPVATPVTTPSVPGTSLGTQVLTITTAGSDGTNTVRHDFQYQVTVQ